ncbi:MauE/DoxX family redox-associated membrane protein [Streptomyces sp. yara]|uniref:MauE/DoxX family redox-associated membrane protein n=1 Tax=Streptomyces sp. yara TaxID=3458421 RepID=UPI0040401989
MRTTRRRRLAFVELALALLLLAGLATRAVAAVTALLMVTYIAAIASVWARGMSIDCGCSSSGGTLTGGAERGYVVGIVRDLAFLGAAAFLITRPRTRYALGRWVLETKER